MPEARIDKWMWAVRIFKTRTIAAEACKKGRISINGSFVKAARMIKPGDVIQVKKPPITYSFKVLQAIEKRVGAKLVSEMMENVTTPDQYELLEMSKISGFIDRARGTGRPTKKDRRSIEEFTTPEFMDDFDFDFDLPEELIAQFPLEQRDNCRLLHVVPEGGYEDLLFHDIKKLLRPGDLLVMNNTFVIKARLRGHKATGGAVEALIERVTGEKSAIAMMRASKSPKAGTEVIFENHEGEKLPVKVGEREGEFFELEFPDAVLPLLDKFGSTPLPPYIERDANAKDESTYQTVYAKIPGAVAAPTAGLHFTRELLDELKAEGIDEAYVTLHVGAGTFQPVREEKLSEHKMHSEWYSVSPEVAAKVNETKAKGGRIVAVGTTSLRTLEAAAVAPGRIQSGARDTTLFVTPGYKFNTIDALITNFHLPKSTLVMLVSAIAGRERILDAYRHAIENKYRFFSYGDAMFLENAPQAK